jgi:hypothetical protein
MMLEAKLSQSVVLIQRRWKWGILLLVVVGLFLRTYRLDAVPASLYWEEVALGYDAYAILHTGKDAHGHAWPVTAFVSFGDYKPALYFYAIVPFLPLFGLSAWAVRLPSALAGTSEIIAIAWLAYLFLHPKDNSANPSATPNAIDKAKWGAIFAAFFHDLFTLGNPIFSRWLGSEFGNSTAHLGGWLLVGWHA